MRATTRGLRPECSRCPVSVQRADVSVAQPGKLTDNELNIRVDSLQVTDDGVVGKFSAKNVDIPNGDAGGDGQTGGCAGL